MYKYSRIKLSRKEATQRNSPKFSPAKVSGYIACGHMMCEREKLSDISIKEMLYLILSAAEEFNNNMFQVLNIDIVKSTQSPAGGRDRGFSPTRPGDGWWSGDGVRV